MCIFIYMSSQHPSCHSHGFDTCINMYWYIYCYSICMGVLGFDTYIYVYVYMHGCPRLWYIYLCLRVYAWVSSGLIHISMSTCICMGVLGFDTCIYVYMYMYGCPRFWHMYLCLHVYAWVSSVLTHVSIHVDIHIQYIYRCAECCLFYRALLQKRPIILSILLTKATPYMYWQYIYRCHSLWVSHFG